MDGSLQEKPEVEMETEVFISKTLSSLFPLHGGDEITSEDGEAAPGSY